jgi:hypothetical protein
MQGNLGRHATFFNDILPTEIAGASNITLTSMNTFNFIIKIPHKFWKYLTRYM